VKLLYKPLGVLVGVTGGLLAGAAFKQVWRRVGREDEAPTATDHRRGWSEVLAAAALQGAIFGVVKAAIDRAGAVGYSRLTGVWPGE
jgi:predicted metal-dependent enzyme (double-stranded beta helix superfamily)